MIVESSIVPNVVPSSWISDRAGATASSAPTSIGAWPSRSSRARFACPWLISLASRRSSFSSSFSRIAMAIESSCANVPATAAALSWDDS